MTGTKTPKDFTATTLAWMQEKAGRIDEIDVAMHIDQAVKEYSRHRPNEVAQDMPGASVAGSNDLVLPATYVDGYSRIISVEYPVDNVPETMLVDDEWSVYRKPTGPVLRVVNYAIKTTETARVTFTRYHDQGSDPSTFTSIIDGDFPAVCALAASYAVLALANTYSQDVDPQSDAVLVDGTDRRRTLSQAAKELREIFTTHMGISTGDDASSSQGFAQGWVDLDTPGPGYGSPMTHPRRFT